MTHRYLSVLLLVAACGELAETDSPDASDAVAVQFNGGGGPPPPPPICLQPRGRPVDHFGMIGSEDWLDTTIHRITGDLTITGTVKIPPCAVVEIAAKTTITVSGSLVLLPNAYGVGPSIWRLDASAWNQILVTTGGTLSLSGSTVDGGGGGTSAAAIVVDGGTLIAHSAAIRNSASMGLRVTTGTIDASSYNLTISGSATAPVFINANIAGSLPLGSYTGNAIDEIQIPTSSWNVVSTSQTWHNQGVPYHIIGSTSAALEVRATTGVAVLTIDPGTTLAFDRNSKLAIDSAPGQSGPASGALVAAGTADAPITFTSAAASQNPGDWLGIWLGHKIDPRTKIDHAVIAFAGGASTSSSFSCATPLPPQNDAAIRMMHLPTEPLTSFVTNTTIISSGKHGIDRGYHTGGSPADFTATNTFIGLPQNACPQTRPDGICTMPPSC
ncbi:MAG TPA: hypothetical protein VGO00_25960 [Kofleriaceae bacterium]|nr:hypothetical protein [Kofleriaceae bacterium]